MAPDVALSGDRDFHADHRERVADQREIDDEMRRSLADERERLADQREQAADQRDLTQDQREAGETDRQRHGDKKSHERDRVANERDRVADERDRVADERDRVADERHRVADQREIDNETSPWQPSFRQRSRVREVALAAQLASLRQRLASVALDVARVEEGVATAFDRCAERVASRAGELRAIADAARRFADKERLAARRLGVEAATRVSAGPGRRAE